MTKLIFTTLLAATAYNASAADTDFCANVNCTPEMQSIATEFETLNKFPAEPIAAAYSGSCYMMEGSINPTVEHHGMFFFETANSYTSATGAHSYFAKTNPWLGQTFADIKTKLEKSKAILHPIIVTPSEATLTFTYPDQKISHFFRTSADDLTMIWLTEWRFSGGMKRIYCRLQRN